MWPKALLLLGVAGFVYYWHMQPALDTLGLAGKRVVVCGASTGIGEETALLYAGQGAKLVIAARRKAALELVAEKCLKAGAAEVHVVTVDFGLEEDCERLIAESTKLLGGIDVLILNHIVGYWDHWGKEGRLDVMRKILEVNTMSYVSLATHALPLLEQSNGSVAVVSSLAGNIGLPKVAPYAASKHALHGFFDSLRLELVHNQSQVSVSICVLGNIDTPNARANTGTEVDHLQRYPAIEAAKAIVAGVAQRHRRVYYPWIELWPTTILHTLFPDTMDFVLRKIIYRD